MFINRQRVESEYTEHYMSWWLDSKLKLNLEPNYKANSELQVIPVERSETLPAKNYLFNEDDLKSNA